MSDRITIDISDHPSVSSIKRRAVLVNFDMNVTVKKITITYDVSHYITDGIDDFPVEGLQSVRITKTATNKDWVDVNGDFVPRYLEDGTQNPDWFVNGSTEYDYLKTLPNSGSTVWDSVSQIITSYTQKIDTRGDFGSKIYNK